MLGALVDTVMVMGLCFGGVAVAYVVYALLHLPLYLLGRRK
jgi:predicted phosphoribosyltransferase